MIKMLAFALIGISSIASATDAVSIPRVTPYADGVGTDDVRQKCDWNSKLSENIAHSAEMGVSVTDKDVSQISGKVLTMRITSVHAIGGGGWTGPKWAAVHGELHDGGKLVGSFEAHQHTTVGMTACGALNRLGKELGEDIADWLKSPTLDAKL
ncbi:hypothetical protein [Dyella psychrodurans]|uniref:DUF4410 domain-containing protein n=1 Tax=Dyella psychrodurans TaxID=1927960 RepID=A0A370X0J3_9GAMM|nr:hypothetical protein [Dyella psychrodurans]RDS81787.1 hypothetical protein DWU99_15265 [Dyella psychrodurans]